MQEFVGENNRGVSGKPGRKLDGVLHKVLHFLAPWSEILTDLDTGAAAVEILGAVGVSDIKRGVFQGGFWFRKIPYGLLFGRRVEDRLEAGIQVDGFKEFGFKKVRNAIPPFSEKVVLEGKKKEFR